MRRLLHLLVFNLLAILLCGRLPVLAQDDVPPAESDSDLLLLEDTELDGAAEPGDGTLDLGSAEVLGTRSLTSVLSDTTALTVLPAGDFAEAESIGEVLERVPGMDVRMSGGIGQLATAQVRGARANQVLVLLDGVPVNPGAGADLAALPLEALERVEVLRGPEAARFGPGALGGVINLVTRRHRPRERVEESAQLPVNEHLSDLARGEPRDDQQEAVQVELTAGSFSSGRAALTWDSPSALIGIEHAQARNNYSFPRNGKDEIRRNDDATTDQFWTSWDAGGLSHRASLTLLHRGVPGSAEFPTLSARFARESLYWQAAEQDWRAGFSLERTRFSDPQPYLHTGALENGDTRARLEWASGIFAGARDGWGFKPNLALISSEQYGHRSRGGLDATYATESSDGPWTLQAEAGLTASSDVGVDPLARLGTRYKFDKSTSAYAAAGYAVRHPSFDELYLTGTGSVEGNPDLLPERAFSCEAGFNLTTPGVAVAAAGFYTRYYDSIIFAPVSAYLVRAINTGCAKIGGVEGLLDIPVSREVSWHSAYTWLPLAEFDSGIALAGRAEQHLNSRLDYSGGSWKTSLALDYTGSMPADLFGSLVIKPRSLVSFEAEKRFAAGTLSMGITNLFDTATRDAWGYPLPGRALSITWRVEL